MRRFMLLMIALLTIQSSYACTANFTYNASPVNNSILNFTFTNTSTHPTTSGSGSSTIFFGDGSSSYIDTSVSHNYADTGTYTVMLTTYYYDSSTLTICYDTIKESVYVGYQPCATKLLDSMANDSMVYFWVFNPAGTSPMTYNLDLGDGTSATVSSFPYVYVYSSPGSYTATLTAASVSAGCTYTNEELITISKSLDCSKNHASFTVSKSINTITCTNTSTTGAGSVYSTTYDYGDGTFSTSSTHTYLATGTYTITLTEEWADSSVTSTCTDTVSHSVVIDSVAFPIDCSKNHASFTKSQIYSTVTFNNTSVTGSGILSYEWWDFGDGTTSSATNPVHNYTTTSSYSVRLIVAWVDSARTYGCMDTVYDSVRVDSVVGGPSVISGTIYKDSAVAPIYADFEVYLITYDSATSIITAMDSTYAFDYGSGYTYYFNSEPSGNYLIKAYITNNDTSGTGYVPTYHDSSTYWATANYLNYIGGTSATANIYMQKGILTSGPGFIGGDVLTGAGRASGGKGTVGTPVAGLIIYLEDASGKLVEYTHTDAKGNYSFNNIALGSYIIFPEDMGYTTISYPVTLSSGASKLNSINFKQNSTTIEPSTTGIENVTAENKISIYPNPTTGMVTIQWNNTKAQAADVTVTNITGQKVFQTQLKASNQNALNLSQLNSGIYLINVTSDGIREIQKIIVQH
ncbi:MAG TPA: PKD domain-containing protein [Flavipsychrobacter sp.]|nr:PKD domain-containing protein [Flavipsychrobacter sp.]